MELKHSLIGLVGVALATLTGCFDEPTPATATVPPEARLYLQDKGLTTLAGGEATLWPVELKVELLEGVTPLKRITIERCDCYTDSEFAAIGDNFDGATGYRVEDGKRYVKGKYQVPEDPEVEIELWQDEDTDEPLIWHNTEVGEYSSGMPFVFTITADPAKPDFDPAPAEATAIVEEGFERATARTSTFPNPRNPSLFLTVNSPRSRALPSAGRSSPPRACSAQA